MSRMYHILEDYNERTDGLLEKAFKEGCEHGYRKAMRESNYNERGQLNYRESFEEKIEKLKHKYQ